MKSKLYKIMGVVLTFIMLASLSVGLTAVPASAAHNDLEWETYNLPVEGARGDWFMNSRIQYVGPIAQAINDDLYAAVGYYDESWEFHNDIFKSTDGGRKWSISEHPLYAYPLVSDVTPLVQPYGNQIYDIVCSSENADVLYVTDGSNVYYSKDGGTTFAKLAPSTLATALTAAGISPAFINSLDVGYIDGEPYVFISVDDTDTTQNGDIFYLKHVGGFALAWTCLNLQAAYGAYDPYTVNCPPNFENSSTIYAVISYAGGPSTIVVTNSGEVGTWLPFGAELWEVMPPANNTMAIDHASNICFPDDFADDELYVGVSGSSASGNDDDGGVYRVDSLPAPGCTFRLFDTVTGVFVLNAGYWDVWSLDITGSIGSVQLLAGAEENINVWYSNTDGNTWTTSRKPPTGDDTVYVLMADDFATSDEAFAATYGRHECGFSRTTSGGDLWNQISLISADMDRIQDVSFYPDYCSSSSMFLITKDDYYASTDSLWRFDGEYWERVAEEEMLQFVFPSVGDVDIHLVQVSPDILTTGVVYFTGWNEHWPSSGNPVMFRSADEGEFWAPIGCQPEEVYSWIVIDKNTIIVGGDNAEVHKNTSGGTRCWSRIDTTLSDDDYILDLAFTGDTVLAVGYYDGPYVSEVAISEDVGATWDMVNQPLPDYDYYTCVAFDTDFATNSTFYVANDDNIYRCVIDSGLPWYAQEFTDIDGGVAIYGISGIVTYNGCLYVSDWYDGYGMWRSVNPTAPMLPATKAPLFERVGYPEFDTVADPDADFEYANIYWLQATCNNTIWALDDDYSNVLWTFTDCLCCGVELTSPECGSVSGRTNSVYLDWEDACNAECYDVWVNTNEDFLSCCWIRQSPCTGPDSCLQLSDLPSGTTYYWMVRVAPGSPLASKWSTACSFSTQMSEAEWNPFRGPVSEYPYPGSGNVPIRPTFAWNVADWATGYEFVLADNEAFVGPLAEETVASAVYVLGFDLQHSTTYYWKVRAVNATSASNWATGIFTTAAGPPAEVFTCAIDGLTFDTRAELEAHIATAHAPVVPTTPFYIWVIVAIGAVLVISVIVLIVTTRRTP